MKDELPESFKKGLEATERGEAQKTTPTVAKEATPSDKKQETTLTNDKDKVSKIVSWHDSISASEECALNSKLKIDAVDLLK